MNIPLFFSILVLFDYASTKVSVYRHFTTQGKKRFSVFFNTLIWFNVVIGIISIYSAFMAAIYGPPAARELVYNLGLFGTIAGVQAWVMHCSWNRTKRNTSSFDITSDIPLTSSKVE